MSLPVETTVIIVLAVIVLVALLFFFSGTFGPGMDRIKLEQQKTDLCTRYVSQDSECKGAASSEGDLNKNLQEVCTKLGLSTVPGSCSNSPRSCSSTCICC